MTDLNSLAAAARPINHEDWGSERQIEAQNAFFQEIEKLLPSAEFEALENYCLKATTDEMIDRALELASVHAQRK